MISEQQAITYLVNDLAPLVVNSGMKHKDFMLQVERAVFTAALNEAKGSPTRAARHRSIESAASWD
jgi:hypothetical protein